MKQIIIIIAYCFTGHCTPQVIADEATKPGKQAITLQTTVNYSSALSSIGDLNVTVKMRNAASAKKPSALHFSTKQRVLDFPVLLAAVAIVAVASAHHYNKSKESNFTDIMIIQDSSPQTIHPNIESLSALYGFYLDLGQRATFRLNVITGSRILNPKETSISNGAESVAQNPDGAFSFRFRQLEGFFDNIRGILVDHMALTEAAGHYNNSEVFRTIANDLNIFSTGTANEQTMLVYSSLREQSDLFSCTSDEDLQLLYSSPKEIASRFNKAVKLGKLKRVKVVFVYAPVDEDDERFFMQMVAVYRLVLKHTGAAVSVQSQDKKYWI